MAQLILTLVGPDRPGLVSRLSGLIAGHGGSWQESRLAHLAGEFAGIVLVSLPDAAVAALGESLAVLDGEGLKVTLHPAPGQAAREGEAALVLELVCQDRPGIVRDIASVLAGARVNIEELTTGVASGSFSGEAMFHAEAKLRLPRGVAPDAIRGALEQLGNELMVDIRLSDAPAAS
jgi:glycine cleavage system regulatory protein